MRFANFGCQSYFSYESRSFSTDPISSGSSPPAYLTTSLNIMMEMDTEILMEMDIALKMDIEIEREMKMR